MGSGLRVTGLSLPTNNLSGFLPRELGELGCLETVGNWTKVKRVSLNNNNLTGSLAFVTTIFLGVYLQNYRIGTKFEYFT